jgi:hypothetical protein
MRLVMHIDQNVHRRFDRHGEGDKLGRRGFRHLNPSVEQPAMTAAVAAIVRLRPSPTLDPRAVKGG